MNVLILEDEIPAYNKLLLYLTKIHNGNIVHTHIRSVKEGIKLLSDKPSFDLILSDIKLLDGSSFQIFNQVEISIPIIFCTAHDEHLLEAFNTNGIAYVLKPYSIEEIANAINKFKNLIFNKPIDQNILNEFREQLNSDNRRYKKRFAIKKNSGIHLLETKNVSHIEAFGDFSKLIDFEGNTHLISQGVGNLILDLDPQIFFKVNRSHIVNINFIEKINAYSKNRLSIHIKNTKSRFLTSSSNSKEFRKWLNF